MRRVILSLAVILILAAAVMAQTTPAPAPVAKPVQTTPAMTSGETGDMQIMMSRIAADKTLRMQMVQSLITVANTDSAFRHQMVGAMMSDKEVNKTMMHMQAGEKAAMMKHEGTKAKKTTPATTTPQGK